MAIVASPIEDLGAFWQSSECADELDKYTHSTDVALLAAKRKQVKQPLVLLDPARRALVVKSFKALSYCADTTFYHEHWFQLVLLLDRATTGLAQQPGALEQLDGALLATAVFCLATKLRHGDQCEELPGVADYMKSALSGTGEPRSFSVEDVGIMETKILSALRWDLSAGTSFGSLTMLFSRLAVFAQQSLPALERAWSVSVQLVEAFAVDGAHDFEVTLGALLYGMLAEGALSLQDLLVEPDEEAEQLAAKLNLLGADVTNPKFRACIERASLSSRKELHSALCAVLERCQPQPKA